MSEEKKDGKFLWNVPSPEFCRGYIACLSGPEVKALVEAVQETKATMERWARDGIHGSKFNHESIAAHFDDALSTFTKAVKS